ncbi:putative glycoside hydrolase [Spirochaeta dissipatitropha]
MKSHALLIRINIIAGVLLALVAAGLSAQATNTNDIRYRSETGQGILVSLDGGRNYESRNEGLPLRVAYPFDRSEFRRVSSIGLDPSNSRRVIIATDDQIFLSDNAGQDWRTVAVPASFNRNVIITAVSPSPHNPQHFLMGTSFNGFYETRDGGESWTQLTTTNLFSFINRGAGFYEEISGLAYDPENPSQIFFELGFGGGLYLAERSRPDGAINRVSPIGPDDPRIVAPLEFLPEDRYRSRPLILSSLQRRPASASTEKQKRLELAANRTGIFLNPHQAQSPRLEQHIEFMLEHGMNSVVIDFKDDVGWLTYNSQLPMAKEVNSIFARFDAAELIQTLHEHDIYVIARLVVFKDNRLFRYDSNRFALWDSVEDRPWGDYRTETDAEGNERTVIREMWVDAYSEEVWRYNIDIARELEELGVDEIQFDYIRFPSDGPVRNIQYRFDRPGMRRVDALTSFLRMAREELSIPVGTDVFGFNAWYRTGYLGQDIEAISEYVDVISPMSYPSHFSRDFHREMTYFDRAEFIYEEGSRRAVEMVGESVLIRPYVQAFLIGGELNYNQAEYTEYLHRQLRGTLNSPASGFTLWNMSGRYYMVTRPLHRYTQAHLEEYSN